MNAIQATVHLVTFESPWALTIKEGDVATSLDGVPGLKTGVDPGFEMGGAPNAPYVSARKYFSATLTFGHLEQNIWNHDTYRQN